MAHLQVRSRADTLASSLPCCARSESTSSSLARMESTMYFVGCSTVRRISSARVALASSVAALGFPAAHRRGLLGIREADEGVSGMKRSKDGKKPAQAGGERLLGVARAREGGERGK